MRFGSPQTRSAAGGASVMPPKGIRRTERPSGHPKELAARDAFWRGLLEGPFGGAFWRGLLEGPPGGVSWRRPLEAALTKKINAPSQKSSRGHKLLKRQGLFRARALNDWEVTSYRLRASGGGLLEGLFGGAFWRGLLEGPFFGGIAGRTPLALPREAPAGAPSGMSRESRSA